MERVVVVESGWRWRRGESSGWGIGSETSWLTIGPPNAGVAASNIYNFIKMPRKISKKGPSLLKFFNFD